MNYKIPLWLWVVLLLLFPITFPLAVVTSPIWVPLLVVQSRMANRELARARAAAQGLPISPDGRWVWNGTAWQPLTQRLPST